MFQSDSILIPLMLGIIPALFWLAFWLYEDRKRPEPRGLIFRTFIFGMIAVPLVIPLQRMGFEAWGIGTLSFILVSITEEIAKFFAARFGGLKTKANNEPLDPVIYMITAALGFAALENTLFLIQELQNGGALSSLVITGNMRFIGATLLHIISSATIGVFISIAYYRSKIIKLWFFVSGLILSIILHTVFNLLIIRNISTSIFTTFTLVWVCVVVLLLLFEKIKRIRPFT